MLKSSQKALSLKLKRILIQLLHVFVELPPELNRRQIEAKFLQDVELLLWQAPLVQRWFLRLAYRVFNVLPFCFDFGTHAFLSLDSTKQKAYFDSWLTHHWAVFRDLAKALRGLVLVTCFSSAEIWKYIGYDPLTHVQERTQLRQKLLSDAYDQNL